MGPKLKYYEICIIDNRIRKIHGNQMLYFRFTILFLETIGLEIIPLLENSIYQENIDKAYLYSDNVNIIIGLDIDEVFLRLNDIKLFVKMLGKHRKNCDLSEEIETLKLRIQQLDGLSAHLKLITRTRYERGFLNAIGSVSKTLFGILDNDDLEIINKNTLFNVNNKLKTIINNQMCINQKSNRRTETNRKIKSGHQHG